MGTRNRDGTGWMAARRDHHAGAVGETPWWSPSQLATRYGVTRQTIYAWVISGRLPRPTQHPSGQGYYWLEGELPEPAKGVTGDTVSDDDEFEEAF